MGILFRLFCFGITILDLEFSFVNRKAAEVAEKICGFVRNYRTDCRRELVAKEN